MNTSLKFNKAHAGIFALLIAISLYSLFMITASNTLHAASTPGFFKIPALFGFSSGMNFDSQNRNKSNASGSNNVIALKSKIIPLTSGFKSPVGERSSMMLLGNGNSDYGLGGVKEFLSSYSQSTYINNRNSKRSKNSNRQNNNSSRRGINSSLSGFNFPNIGTNGCLNSLDLANLSAEQIIQCLADNVNTGGPGNGGPTTGGPGTGDPGNGGPTTGGPGTGDPGNGGPTTGGPGTGDPGNGGPTTGGPVVVAIPEPSTYLLLGLGMLTLVGVSRKKKVKARIS